LKAELAELRRPQACSSSDYCSSNFKLILETPESQEKRAALVVKSRIDHGISSSESQDGSGKTWEEMGEFLEELPTSHEGWVKLRSNTQFFAPDIIVNTFKLLILQPISKLSAIPHIKAKASSLDIINAFGNLKRYLRIQANLSKQIDIYSDILVHCMGLVARKAGMSVEDVDELVKTVSGEEQSSVYWMRLRHCGGLAARLIERLENKLGYLGSHLLLLCIISNIHLLFVANDF
jgi:hypothetical protein